jgi:hypothetical protein
LVTVLVEFVDGSLWNQGNKKGDHLSYILNQHQAPSSSSQPKLPDRRNIPPGYHLAILATQTKGGARLSLLGLHIRNWALD